MSLMKTFDALPQADQDIVRAISNAARETLRDAGIKPCNDDHAANFDEACTKFYVASAAAIGMKAQIGDFIKTPSGPSRVVQASMDSGYELENGHVLADSEISLDDVLLESEVTG